MPPFPGAGVKTAVNVKVLRPLCVATASPVKGADETDVGGVGFLETHVSTYETH